MIVDSYTISLCGEAANDSSTTYRGIVSPIGQWANGLTDCATIRGESRRIAANRGDDCAKLPKDFRLLHCSSVTSVYMHSFFCKYQITAKVF
jgi:hypothetical protein